jgi:hypothetical protein
MNIHVQNEGSCLLDEERLVRGIEKPVEEEVDPFAKPQPLIAEVA